MGATTVRRRSSKEPADVGVQPRLWTRKEYYRAADLGLFRPDERLELLDGEILKKMTHKPPHASSLGQTARAIAGAFGSDCHLRQQLPLVLSRRSEPEPDVVVVRGELGVYATEHPTAADALLVIEIADTTLRLDRGRKRVAYARAGIQEYWIVNLRQRQVEVYRNPSGAKYRSESIHGEEEVISPLAAPSASIRVVDLLPLATAA